MIRFTLECPKDFIILKVSTTSPIHVLVMKILHVVYHFMGETTENVLRVSSIRKDYYFLLVRVIITRLYHNHTLLFIVKFDSRSRIYFVALPLKEIKVRFDVFLDVRVVYILTHHSTGSTGIPTDYMGITEVAFRGRNGKVSLILVPFVGVKVTNLFLLFLSYVNCSLH